MINMRSESALAPAPSRERATREPGAAPPGYIPLSVPNVSGREWEFVKDCLDTGWVSSVGSYVTRFEEAIASAVGARHCVAAVSGTAALHLALQVSGVGSDDEVIMPSLTFIAPANAVRYVGGWPTFVDVEADTWQLSAAAIRRFIEESCRRDGSVLRNVHTGRRVRGILPVDILGHPCDLASIQEIAAAHDLLVVEDATEALGAFYRERPLGSISPVTCFSFNGNKLITTGGGGALVTDDAAFAARVRYLSTQAKVDPLEFVHGEVGYNYRLTNVQAAIGVAQMERLSEFVERKRQIAAQYTAALSSVPGLTPMFEAPWVRSASWLYTVLIDAERFGMDSRALLQELDDARIQTRPLWQPLHLSPAHAGSFKAPCPVAADVQARALSLPCSTNLTDDEVERVIDAILKAHTRNSR